MKTKPRFSLPTLAIWMLPTLLLAFMALGASRMSTQSYVFQGVVGPATESHVPLAATARVEDFDRGSPHRLAVLVTDPESDWLGLLRGFRAHGVPVRFTRDPAQAMRHRVVLVYPTISGKVLSADTLRELATHVRGGGAVLGFELAGGGLQQLFGVDGYLPARSRDELKWLRRTGIAEEDTIRVSSESKLWTLGYRPTTADVLASFDDGSAAVLCRREGGVACLMGLDLGRLAQLGMDGGAEPINRRFANGYEPSLDVLFRWVRDLYVEQETMPWLVSRVPGDRPVAIVLTHDVDYGPSVANSKAYAGALAKRGVRGSFFIQTKYRRDFNDRAFFNPAAVEVLRDLRALDMEIASHSVAHSRVFDTFPVGSGREQYPQYQPHVKTRAVTTNGSILGELRVSKFLLDELGSAEVVSFRPGNLAYPFALPQLLHATGYRYSSSFTANRTLTHLPFQLTHDRAGRALVPIFEFPITIEDEELPPLGQRFEQAQRVIRQIARHQGLVVVLNHPDITGHKLEFEERLVDEWKSTAWIGPLRDFGDWWAARDALEVDVTEVKGQWVVQAHAELGVRDLVVHVPKSRALKVRLDVEPGTSVHLPLHQ